MAWAALRRPRALPLPLLVLFVAAALADGEAPGHDGASRHDEDASKRDGEESKRDGQESKRDGEESRRDGEESRPEREPPAAARPPPEAKAPHAAPLATPPAMPPGAPPAAAPAAPPPPTDASFFVALMLLGSVAFVMCIFYLLHFHDDDIRTYAWNVVSSSICTFSGVLIGMSWNQCFVFFVVGPPQLVGPLKTIVCNLAASVGWYIVLQLVLAWVSGAIGPTPTDKVITTLNLKCFAVLLGVTNGASNLALWGLVQTLVPHTFGGTVGVTLTCFFAIGAMFLCGAAARDFISREDDGKQDEYEALWDKFAKETEDQTLCMTLAHLLVQATRLSISGVLPLPAGQMPPGLKPTQRQMLLLALCGLVYTGAIPLIDTMVQVKFLSRFKGWLKKTVAFAAAFCILYSLTWTLGSKVDVTKPPGQMVLALVGTLVGFGVIFLLDFVSDLSCTGEATDREIKALVNPIATLIGFSWKQAFAGAVVTITARDQFLPAPVQTLGCALALVAVVVPAWRLYILPTVMNELVATDDRRRLDSKTRSLVVPLLDQRPANGAPAVAAGAAALGVGQPGDLVKQNMALARRNAELEASIRDIRQELGELKKLAALLS